MTADERIEELLGRAGVSSTRTDNKGEAMQKEAMQEEVTIDGVETTEDWVLVRASQAGVFVGRLIKKDGDEVVLHDARRIWYWDGAATLSQLATEGTSKPNNCKFPPAVPGITVLGVCEIIPVTATALASIQGVPEWRS